MQTKTRLTYLRKWRRENKTKCVKYAQAWQKRNPERTKEIHRNWVKKNPEYYKLRARKWRKEHPNANRDWYRNNTKKSVAKCSKRRAQNAGNGGSFTAEEFTALCIKYNGKCLCCKKRRKLTADHVIPISKGGSSYIANIQPLCKPCNSRKHVKTTDYRT